MDAPGETHYQVLEVSNDATTDEIRKAYRTLALKHHPDKGGDSERFKQINNAHEVLSNPAERKSYDDRLGLSSGMRSNASSTFTSQQNTKPTADAASQFPKAPQPRYRDPSQFQSGAQFPPQSDPLSELPRAPQPVRDPSRSLSGRWPPSRYRSLSPQQHLPQSRYSPQSPTELKFHFPSGLQFRLPFEPKLKPEPEPPSRYRSLPPQQHLPQSRYSPQSPTEVKFHFSSGLQFRLQFEPKLKPEPEPELEPKPQSLSGPQPKPLNDKAAAAFPEQSISHENTRDKKSNFKKQSDDFSRKIDQYYDVLSKSFEGNEQAVLAIELSRLAFKFYWMLYTAAADKLQNNLYAEAAQLHEQGQLVKNNDSASIEDKREIVQKMQNFERKVIEETGLPLGKELVAAPLPSITAENSRAKMPLPGEGRLASLGKDPQLDNEFRSEAREALGQMREARQATSLDISRQSEQLFSEIKTDEQTTRWSYATIEHNSLVAKTEQRDRDLDSMLSKNEPLSSTDKMSAIAAIEESLKVQQQLEDIQREQNTIAQELEQQNTPQPVVAQQKDQEDFAAKAVKDEEVKLSRLPNTAKTGDTMSKVAEESAALDSKQEEQRKTEEMKIKPKPIENDMPSLSTGSI
ncbi:MAG: hypothetical protein CK426_07900 [Legionella sp.]|nr:MAG: hypothetical protein CK423_00805 [Legionella sp.]PJD97357.1 MAG: hypothetical protein CK426_07900 [Legionella sp.]